MSKTGTSITKKCRLLCGKCGTLEGVTGIAPESYAGDPLKTTRVTLACGCARGEILPLKLGRVSFENLRTPVGNRLFPVVSDEWLPSMEVTL